MSEYIIRPEPVCLQTDEDGVDIEVFVDEIVVETDTPAIDEAVLLEYLEAKRKLEAMLVAAGELGLVNDYEILENKPQIEGVELIRNRTLSQIGMQSMTNEEIQNMIDWED